jgi:hypothetical protein
MQEMKAMAESEGIPWPIDKNATKEEAIQRMTRLQVVIFSRMIDEARKAQVD